VGSIQWKNVKRNFIIQNNLILIPARGGSTRVKDKNIRLLGGKPLVQHTIESALKSISGRVVVSTNSAEIASIARSCGAEVPFTRPAELASSTASSLSVIYHVLDWFKNNENWIPEFVLLCPPTNPFRTSETIKEMLKKLKQCPDINSIVTVTVPATHPFSIVREQQNGKFGDGVISIDGKTINDLERKQEWPKVWEGSPACRITRTDYFVKTRKSGKIRTYDSNNFIGYEISKREALDIDTEDDLFLAEFQCSTR